MKSVGIRELKNRLSAYLREVRAGEEILVTARGVVVAELRPPTPPEARTSIHPGLAALARRGMVVLGKANSPELYASLPPIMASGSAPRSSWRRIGKASGEPLRGVLCGPHLDRQRAALNGSPRDSRCSRLRARSRASPDRE